MSVNYITYFYPSYKANLLRDIPNIFRFEWYINPKPHNHFITPIFAVIKQGFQPLGINHLHLNWIHNDRQ